METLARLGIPVAVEASAPLTATAIGRGLLALARLAARTGRPRTWSLSCARPGGPRAGRWTGSSATSAARGCGAPPRPRAPGAADGRRASCSSSPTCARRSSGSVAPRGSRAARADDRRVPDRRRGEVPGPRRSLELRAAAEAERALLEVAELDPDEPVRPSSRRLLDARAGPAAPGRRARHASASSAPTGCALAASSTCSPARCRTASSRAATRAPRCSPTTAARELGLARRSRPRTRSATCSPSASRGPSSSLALSWRETDDEGKRAGALAVRGRGPRPARARAARRPGRSRSAAAARSAASAGPADVVLARPTPPRRPSWRGRSPSAGASGWEASARAGADRRRGHRRRSRRARRRRPRRPSRARLAPRDLRSPIVLEALTETEAVRRLHPRGVRPLLLSLVHRPRAAARSGSTRPTSRWCSADSPTRRWSSSTGSRPGGTAATDRRDAAGLASSGRGSWSRSTPPSPTCRTSDPMALAQIRRVEGLIAAYLTDEAAADRVLAPDPSCSRRSSARGDAGQGDPALELDGDLRPARLDRPRGRRRDARRAGRPDQRLQALARGHHGGRASRRRASSSCSSTRSPCARLWGIEPVGGVYLPLRGTDRSGRPRGIVRDDLADRLAGLEVRREGPARSRGVRAVLDDAAEERASTIAATITRRAGAPRPPRRRVPSLLPLPDDLPQGARHGGARRRHTRRRTSRDAS